MKGSKLRLAVALGCALVTIAAGAATPATGQQDGMLGFTAGAASQEQSLEQRFDAQLNPAELRDWLQQMSSGPNQVGSPHDKANAEFMLAKFKSWGWDAHIETFDVLYPTPKQELVELVAPGTYTAKLHEPQVPGDRTSGESGALPPYNVYGADGDVTAPLV